MPDIGKLRLRGDAALGIGNFSEAVLCFEEAQEQCLSSDKATMLGRLALAHTGGKCFSRGLENAVAANKLELDNPRTLHVQGFCEDALGMYRQSAGTFASAAKKCSNDAELREACARGLRAALRHLKEQTDGKYDWVELHHSGMMVASFCRPCEVRFVPGNGRGLVLREDVAEGALLFATKAFVMGPRSSSLSDAVEQLQTCSQAEFDRFFCLYDGSNDDRAVPAALNMEGRPSSTPEESGLKTQERVVDSSHVRRILNFNQHTRATLGDVKAETDDRICGTWPLAAFMNHSCRPNVIRTFVGDMFVCRAAEQLKVGTELLDHYVPLTQPLHIRRAALQRYEFHCKCARCTLEELVLPMEEATSMMDQAESIRVPSECKGPVLARKSTCSLDKFTSAMEKTIHARVDDCRPKLHADLVLQRACAQLWGTALGVDDMLARLERMLCASFLQYSLWACVSWKQLAEPSKSASGFGRCCDQLEEISPNSELHCYAGAERATQIYRASQEACHHSQKWTLRDAQDAAHVAYLLHACCYGEEIWQIQAKGLDWPQELLTAATAGWKSRCTEVKKEVTSLPCLSAAIQWDYSVSEADGFLWMTVQIPSHIERSNMALEIGDREVLICCTQAGAASDALRVTLTKPINSARAPPAQYRKRLRQLVLQLPLIAS